MTLLRCAVVLNRGTLESYGHGAGRGRVCQAGGTELQFL